MKNLPEGFFPQEPESYTIDLGSDVVLVERQRYYSSHQTHVDCFKYWFNATITYNGFEYTGIGNEETTALQNLSEKIKLAKILQQPSLPEIIKQLESCNFTCEAGSLKNNTAFIALKEMAK